MKELMGTRVSPSYYTMVWLKKYAILIKSLKGAHIAMLICDYCVELWKRLM
jgi:hypothetical protein